MSFCVLFTLLNRYADTERFPKTAFFNIGCSMMWSLSSIGFLGIDLGFTLRNRQDGDAASQE